MHINLVERFPLKQEESGVSDLDRKGCKGSIGAKRTVVLKVRKKGEGSRGTRRGGPIMILAHCKGPEGRKSRTGRKAMTERYHLEK